MDPTIVKEILDFKLNNAFPEGLTKQERFIIKRRSSNFVLKDGVLHYICRRRQDKMEHLAKVVLTAAEANCVFEEFHSSNIGGHCGVEKTHSALIGRYYWPGMQEDIRKWVSQCPDCQAKRASLKENQQYNPIEVHEPFELVGMDLMKLTPTESGNQYICVMVDYFTKWAEAYPLKSKSAEEVTTCILDFVYKFGVPQRLLTDQGTEFKNQVNSRLCESLGIKRSFCTPYHPQTNGLVEKLNGTIQRSLNKLARRNPQKWDKYLQCTMFALRTKKQLTTQYSPYFLMFGREARYPSEVAVNYEVSTETVEQLVEKEQLFEGLLMQKSTYKAVQSNVKKVQDRVVKRKLSKGCEKVYKVGDRVLKKNIQEEQRKGGKMESDMLGPFTIISVQGKNVTLSNEHTRTIANTDQIIHFVEPEQRIPAKLKKTECDSDSPSSSKTEHYKCPAPEVPAQPGTIHVVKKLWGQSTGEILWAKLGPYKIFTEDLQSLAPDRELESELDVSEWETLIGAVCKDRHWTLVVIYPRQGKALFVDPFGATSNQLTQCRDKTRAFLRKKNLHISRWKCETISHPRQQDSTSCGVFVCKIAEQLLLGQQVTLDPEKKAVDLIRLEMATKLIDESDDLTDICHACGDRDTADALVDDWIECTTCKRWFHWVCVGRPNTEAVFFCPACQ